MLLLLAVVAWSWSAQTPHHSAQDAGRARAEHKGALDGPAAHDLSTGQTHSHSVRPAPGQYVRLSLTPSGIGVRAVVFKGDGGTLLQTACARGDAHSLAWIAEEHQETYEVEVSACEAEEAAGGYRLRVEEQRRAVSADGDRVAAGFAFAEAERLRAEGSGAAGDAALLKYEEGARLWRAAGERAGEAEAWRKSGEVLSARGERLAALRHFGQALEAAAASKSARERVRSLNNVCSVRTDMGDYKEARAACALALGLSRSQGDAGGEAQALSNIGMVQYWRSELRAALESQQAALRIWRDLRDRAGEAQSLLRAGYVDVVLGEIPQALDSYRRALPLARAVADHQVQALILTALGHLHSVIGEKQEALNHYDQAMLLSQKMAASEITAQVFSGMGLVYYQLGEWEKALRHRTQALELYRAMPNRWAESSLYLSVGRVYQAMGEGEKALEHYRRGMVIADSMSNAHLESALLREMGTIYESLGESARARAFYRRSLALSVRGGDPRDEVDALNRLGQADAVSGRGEAALGHFERALSVARRVNDRFTESRTLFNIARIQRDLGRMDDARGQAEAAVRLIESLRANVASQDLRTSYFATVRQHYELYIDVLMRLRARRPAEGLDALGFEMSERARARSLLETVAASRSEIRQGVDSALLERERVLQQQLNAKVERQMRVLGGPHTKEEAAAVAAEVEALTREFNAVEAEIRTRSPHYATLTQPQPLSLEEIQRRVLDDQTVLLEYALGDERSYVWAVTRDSVAGYELPGRARIEESARRLYGLLTARQGVPGETAEQYRERAARSDADYWREAEALGRMILGPVAEHLTEGRRLLVVADGALQYVPFGALTTPGAEVSGAGEEGQGQSGARPDGGDHGERAPLFTRHEVVSLPSASILPALQGKAAERETARETSVAVFADPVFDRDDPRVGRADSSRSEADASHAAADAVAHQSTQVHRAIRDVSALFGGDGGVPRLLASREEADAIAAALPSGEAALVTDFGASRAAAIEPGLGRHRVIHFATHGILNSERPELSGIVLSLVNERGEPQEGFLSLNDIYNLKLPADLVVLSACNTALGKEVRGEGLIGLTRGFMYAGASSVVASLWKVDDEATAELMKHFYEGMFRHGLAPPAALRQAQLAMWRQKRWRAPYYWAAFVIQGQYGELQGTGERPAAFARWGLAAWGGGAAAISFAALCAIRLRRRRRELAGAEAAKP